MWTKRFLLALLERALVGAATGFLSVGSIELAVDTPLDFWKAALIAALTGFVFSVAKGLIANAANGGTGPGIGKAETTEAKLETTVEADNIIVNADQVGATTENHTSMAAENVYNDGSVEVYETEFGAENWVSNVEPDASTAVDFLNAIQDADDVVPDGSEDGLVQISEGAPILGFAAFTSPAPVGLAARVISTLKAEAGYKEGRSGGHWNNNQKFSLEQPSLRWSNFMAWCATFVCWGFAKNGGYAPIGGSSTAAVAVFRDRAKASGRFSEYPAVGAIMILGQSGVHTGVVYAYDSTYIYTIEGNTNDSGSAEGNGVYLKRRTRASVYGYFYPNYPEGIYSADPAWANRAPKANKAPVKPTTSNSGAAWKPPVSVDASKPFGWASKFKDQGVYPAVSVKAFNAAMAAGKRGATGQRHGAEREVWAVEQGLKRLGYLQAPYSEDKSAGTSTQEALDKYRDKRFSRWPLADRRGTAGKQSLNQLCWDAGIKANWSE